MVCNVNDSAKVNVSDNTLLNSDDDWDFDFETGDIFSVNNNSEPTLPVFSQNLPSKNTAGCSLANIYLEDGSLGEYIAEIFPKGQVSALVGESGKGKSWVTTAVALTITASKEFLPTDDYELRSNGKVLLIETEGRIPIYAQRIKELGGDLENFIVPDKDLKILSYQSSKDRDLVEKVVEVNKPDLIFVDSLAGFSDADENTYL